MDGARDSGFGCVLHLPTLVLLGTSTSIELLDDYNYTTLGTETFIPQPELRNYGPQCHLGQVPLFLHSFMRALEVL